MVKAIESKEDFDTALKEAGDKLVVVDFHATWCGPCKVIGPKVEELDKELAGAVVFLKIDVDEVEEVAAENNISCMPTFLFFKNTAKVHEFSGANYDKLKAEVERLK